MKSAIIFLLAKFLLSGCGYQNSSILKDVPKTEPVSEAKLLKFYFQGVSAPAKSILDLADKNASELISYLSSLPKLKIVIFDKSDCAGDSDLGPFDCSPKN